MADELTELFAQVGLDKYADKLKEEGVDDTEMLAELTQEDLENMGVPKIRARAAVKKIAELQPSDAGGTGTAAGAVAMPTDFAAAAKANPNWSQFSLTEKKFVINGYENAYQCALRIREICGNPNFVITFDPSGALLQPPYHEELLKHWRKENSTLTPSQLTERTMRRGGKGDWAGVTNLFLSHFGMEPSQGLEKNHHFRELLRVVEKACEDELSKDNFNETIDRFHFCTC